jgi:hypothetical protein
MKPCGPDDVESIDKREAPAKIKRSSFTYNFWGQVEFGTATACNTRS